MRGGTRRLTALLVTATTLSCGRAPASEPAATVPPSGLHPAATSPTPGLEPCGRASTQTELTSCWGTESRRAEQAARDAFERAVALLRDHADDDALQALGQAEAAWAAYRDAQCDAAAALFRGGSLGAMQRARCRADRAEERRLVLERFAADLMR